jgi:hypothetical protein
MRGIAVGNKPPFLDRLSHCSVGGLVIQAQPLGNLVHADPVTGSPAACPHDIVTHGAGGILCSVAHGP